MNRDRLYLALYLLVALALDHGVLRAFGPGWDWLRWSELRLVATGAILAGLLRKPIEAYAFAFVGAVVWGAVQGPGCIGATLLSFAVATFLATMLARPFYLEAGWVRLTLLYALVALESWIWSATRRLLWPELPLEMQWPTHAWAAVAGVLLYKSALGGGLRDRGAPPWPIGRRRPGETV